MGHESKSCPLSADQIAAIHLYTQESPFYKHLNLLLRNRDRGLLNPFLPYLALLMSALRKLRCHTGTLFRGVKKNIVESYRHKKRVVWWSISSTSTSTRVLETEIFCGSSGARTIFNIDARYAVDISGYSAMPSEEERVLLPGAVLQVKSVADLGDVKMVHLEEVAPPLILAEFGDEGFVHRESRSKCVVQ
eukprot:TRINITY_DN4542_c0_g1_i1.p1 TRINITY_DN4542_c0_g1~~TRINITY_DN4542_c0_g1_i1.p1  ORF type:complete len:201 (-),score=43.73 TRINITY_DN4542_c0_g1_i1:198-770(-)